jgi:hypothetical protein
VFQIWCQPQRTQDSLGLERNCEGQDNVEDEDSGTEEEKNGEVMERYRIGR